MKEPWEKLEAQMRAMEFEPLSPELEEWTRRCLAASRPLRGSSRRRLVGWALVAAASLLLAGLFVWLAGRGGGPGLPAERQAAERPQQQTRSGEVELAAGWRVQPTGAAEYRVLKPNLINLQRGELLVESLTLADGRQGRSQLRIETPAGTARADGTKFYIGTHRLPPQTTESKGATMSSVTRVLVLAGVVTLANAMGSVAGQANHLLAAESGKAPVDYAVTANSDFSLDLYRQLSKENQGKNLFFSPYSVSSALVMVAEGARGQTALEIGNVLHFPQAARRLGDDAQLIPWNTALMHTGMGELNERLAKAQKPVPAEITAKIEALRKKMQACDARRETARKVHKGDWVNRYYAELKNAEPLNNELNKLLAHVNQYEVHVANALWGEKTHPFLPSYVATIHKFYQTGGLFPVDFKNAPEAARQEINDWVEKQTADKIKELLAQGTVNDDTRMVLTNAIYFLGNWSDQFDPRRTSDQDFSVSATEKVKAPLMHKTRKYRYAEDDSVQMLELPYKGDDLSMLVLLPREANGLAELEKSLSAAAIGQWRAGLETRKVEAYLPKFKMETCYNNLKDTLEAMGMKQAFVKGGADFSGIDAGAGYLYISLVVHKAFVNVNEQGTEAAAATAVGMAATGKAPRPEPPVVFRADHPFLFMICDNRSGNILFLGKMLNPKQ